MRRVVAVVLAGSVLAATGIAFSPAADALAPPVKTKVSKHVEGPFKGSVQAGLDPGEQRDFYFRVKNRSGVQQDTVTFEQLTGLILGFSIKWYKQSNGKNITSDVAGDGYQFKLAPGAGKIFRVKITSATTDGLCLSAQSDIDGMPPAVSLASLRLNGSVCV